MSTHFTSSESSFTVSAAERANSVMRIARADRADECPGSSDVSPFLAAVTRCWRGDTYDFMAFSVGVEGSTRAGEA